MVAVKDLLPIGSIVLLKGGVKRIMVFGIKQTNDENNQEYDYIGVLYPEGNLGGDYQYLFNQEDIEEVIFKGFEDDERGTFLDALQKFYDDKKD